MKVIVTVRSKADPRESRTIEQDGDDYYTALNTLTARIPEGWQLLHILTVQPESQPE